MPSPISSSPQPVLCGCARILSIRKSADQNRQDQIRFGAASCGLGTSGSVVVRSEVAMDQGEYRFEACDAPADQAWGTPIAAEKPDGEGISMPDRTAGC